MNSRSLRAPRGALLLALLAAIAVALLDAAPASAHDTAGNAIVLVVNERRVTATAAVPFTELGLVDTSGDGLLDSAELASQEAGLASTLVHTVRDHVQLTIDGEDAEIIGAGVPSISATATDGEASAFVTLVFATGPMTAPSAASGSHGA